jgi:RNA polymerase sigma-70 factor (ECF subfamily)
VTTPAAPTPRGPGPGDGLDWPAALRGPERESALERLFGMLVGVARGEVRRRSGELRIGGAEADDLAHQSAADALVRIDAKLDGFRGESRFTTWAYAFVVLEVSSAVGRHVWRRPRAVLDDDGSDAVPDRLGPSPAGEAERRELVAALRRAVVEALTPHQRRVFTAVVVQDLPIDAVAHGLGSNRNAVYKTVFDARRRLRARLAADGLIGEARR